jgi:catechol 2,3-dioxygenase-like lactoylglutathione lyase family enzyme
MIKGVKFVSIPVRDQARAVTFYTEKLGFSIMTDQPFDEKQRWIELGIPGADTKVVLFTPVSKCRLWFGLCNLNFALFIAHFPAFSAFSWHTLH